MLAFEIIYFYFYEWLKVLDFFLNSKEVSKFWLLYIEEMNIHIKI